jgi:poly(A) polymerase/tRNA nucleotidyltransferase (CCA-adding enzyme)
MKTEMVIPEYVQKVGRILTKEGYEAYIVGGALRDVVLGKTPHDYDIATNALPDEMLNMFPKAVSTGAKFGTVVALIQDKHGETHEVEVTTFRSESDYVDGRWPSNVNFVDDIDKDLGRRDFTFNAMALDLSQLNLDGREEPFQVDIYDPYGGVKDINIEEETFKAIKESIPVAAQVSMERIRDEFMKMLINSPKPSVGIELMRESGLLSLFMPELLEGVDVEQKLFHAHDVYKHALKTCDVAHDSVKLAALLHDIAKPRTDMGNGHFYGHDKMGADIAEEIMQRMKFSQSEINRVKILIENHMFYYPHVQEEMTDEEKENIEKHQWTDTAVRRFIQRVGEENIDDLFKLRLADAQSNPATAFKPEEITILQRRISEVRKQDMALKVTDLKVSGEDLMNIGIEKGPKMGIVLSELLDMVVEDPALNRKDILLEKATELNKKN